MKWLVVLLASSYFFVAIGCASQSEPEQAVSSGAPEAVAFVNVNVLPMDKEQVLTEQTVLVRGDRIVEVGAADAVKVPEEAQQIDGSGKYLMPGLTEMHGHIPNPDTQPDFTKNVLMLYLANGVTTVRGMQGQPGQLELREKANSGKIWSPTLYLAGPPFTGGSVDGPESARQKVLEQEKAGWDYLKVLEGMSRKEYDAMVKAADEVNIPFVGHVPNEVGLARVIKANQGSIDHLDGYIEHLNGHARDVPDKALQQVVEQTKDAGICVVPTMALWETLQGTATLETLQSYSELQYMPPAEVNGWVQSHKRRRESSGFDEARAQQVIDNRMCLLRALNKADACIVFGTDAPQQFSVPGFSIHHEIKRMVQAGMSPYEILRSGTQTVGKHLSDKDSFGTVTTGQRADLLLLNANPLEDASQIKQRAGVMVRGRWLPEAEIQERLDQIASSY